MKCINKWLFGCTLILGCLFFAGCGKEVTLNNAYDVYETTDTYSGTLNTGASLKLMASDLCVGGTEDTASSELDANDIGSAGLFQLDKQEITYSKNLYAQRYPASLTKVLTAYVALKYGKLSDEITVSEEALAPLDDGSSLCGLSVGDQLTLDQLLYGLLLESGNDAANVIAEYIAGDTASFCELMNKEAMALGACDSHFANANGLPNDDHYTTAYDMYLIFNAAIQDENFVKYISSGSYEGTIKNINDVEVDVFWENTNGYMTGEYNLPENITLIGGKTGTTAAAGNCLILYYTDNTTGEPEISIVMKGEERDILYNFMTDMLSKFSK